jgi:hypothetical protein
MRNGPAANPHAHQHEWRIPQTDAAFNYEDGALYVHEHCHYVEQKCVGTSSRGETYYETMYECEGHRAHRYDLVGIKRIEMDQSEELGGIVANVAERLAESREEVLELHDEHPMLAEEIESRAAERLTEGADGDPHPLAFETAIEGTKAMRRGFSIGVEYDGERYEAVYEHTDVRRLD